jgi:hypothetical protein
MSGVSQSEIKPYYKVPFNYVGSYLIHLPITDVSKATEIYLAKHPNRCFPLVLLPSKKFLQFWVSIPEGLNLNFN